MMGMVNIQKNHLNFDTYQWDKVDNVAHIAEVQQNHQHRFYRRYTLFCHDRQRHMKANVYLQHMLIEQLYHLVLRNKVLY